MKYDDFKALTGLPFYHKGELHDGTRLKQNTYCVKCLRKGEISCDKYNDNQLYENKFQHDYCHKGYNLLRFKSIKGEVYTINGIIKHGNVIINPDTYKARKNMIVMPQEVEQIVSATEHFESVIGSMIAPDEDLGENFAILHDVKNTIGILVNHAELVVRKSNGKTFIDKLNNSSREVKDLYDAVELTNSQLQMIDIVINPAQIKYGEKEFTNVYRMFEKVSKLLYPRSHKKNMRIIWDTKDLIEQAYYYEAIQFLPLILLENAIKYGDSNTRIHVEFSLPYVDRIQIVVSSVGESVPYNERKKIFEKYQRGSNAMKSHQGGIGLGLWLVKQILSDHNGSIIYRCDERGTKNHINIFQINMDYNRKK